VSKRRGELSSEGQDPWLRQRPTSQKRTEGCALEKLQDHEGDTLVHPKIVQLNNVWVLQLCDHTGFAAKGLKPKMLGVCVEMIRTEGLDRDLSIKKSITREIDGTHSALSQATKDVEASREFSTQ